MKTDVEDLYKRYGITAAEIQEWAKTKANIVNNPIIQAIMYIRESKGIGTGDFNVFGISVPESTTSIKYLVPDKMLKIKGFIPARSRSNSYIGCPQCKKKLDEDGMCPKCNEIVTPTEYMFEDWIVGDDSGEIVTASFPPNIVGSGLDLENKYVTLVGMLEISEYNGREQRRFNVKKILTDDKVSVPEKPKSGFADSKVTAPLPGSAGDVTLIKENESKQLRSILKVFNPSMKSNLENWHKKNKFVTPLEELLVAVGAKVVKDSSGIDQVSI